MGVMHARHRLGVLEDRTTASDYEISVSRCQIHLIPSEIIKRVASGKLYSDSECIEKAQRNQINKKDQSLIHKSYPKWRVEKIQLSTLLM